MQEFLDLLKQMKSRGNGTYYRHIYGSQTRYDLSNGTLPISTTNKVDFDVILKMLLWAISGSINVEDLKAQGINSWNDCAVTKEDVLAITKKYSQIDAKAQKVLSDYWLNNHLNSVGEIYSSMWRNAPRKEIMTFWPDVAIQDLPSDKVPLWENEYQEIKDTAKDEIISLETYCKYKYYETVDQLNELIIGLKAHPLSMIHVVSSWIPSHVPFVGLSPQENVLLGKASVASDMLSFQCIVIPAVDDDTNKKPYLSMVLTQRVADLSIEQSRSVTQYGLLLALIAHCVDMIPGELIWNVGDSVIHEKRLHCIDTELCRVPYPLPALWINPNKKDLFSLKFEDVKLVNYQSHSKIVY